MQVLPNSVTPLLPYKLQFPVVIIHLVKCDPHHLHLENGASHVHCWLLSRFQALRCIGDLVVNNPKNRDTLASKVLGEEPHVEPALNSILRIILRTSSIQEFVSADYVFKSFCEVCIPNLIWKWTTY